MPDLDLMATLVTLFMWSDARGEVCVCVGLCPGYNGTCAGPSLGGVIAEQFGPVLEENSRKSVFVGVDFF